MSKYPRLAAACNAVNPVRGDASFANANDSTSPASSAFRKSFFKSERSPPEAAAWRDSSWAAEGDGFGGLAGTTCGMGSTTSGSTGAGACGGIDAAGCSGAGSVAGTSRGYVNAVAEGGSLSSVSSAPGYTNPSSSESSTAAPGEALADCAALDTLRWLVHASQSSVVSHILFDRCQMFRRWVRFVLHSLEAKRGRAALTRVVRGKDNFV